MDYRSYVWAIVVLIGVLALIMLLAWLVRRSGVMPGMATRMGRGPKRMEILEVLPVDVKSKLVLVKRDGVEHLLLLGAQSDLVVEKGLPAANGEH